jgi:hypothetical protein
VRKLDAEFPGSTFERTLKSYGKDGLYLVIVAGPFSDLSKDVARLRAVRLLNDWDISPGQALALNRRLLIQKFGHLTSLPWTRLIFGRFRDAASRLPLETTTGGEGADSDDPLILLNINDGAYRGRHVPDA